MRKVFIIAEAGVNHNGNIDLAKKMIEEAKKAGADAVKFQTFVAEKLVSKFTQKAAYQKNTTDSNESMLQMIKKYELNIDAHNQLMDYCRIKNIIFLSTPFDMESIDLLNSLGLSVFKIPSGEITNFPYLKKIGSLNKKIIISTGMSDLKEIKEAIEVLNKAGTSTKNISILHCNTEYPTPFEDVNLNAMLTIKKKFKTMVGYSDHTLGIEVPIAAVALGAEIIEKHFTLNRNMDGPDHKASLEPKELTLMVQSIRNIEKALGDGVKKMSSSELKNINSVRKSIVALKDIKKDEIFTKENITVKRPGDGISPKFYDKIIGKKSKKNFKEDELIVI
jgi:N,N'-diacetyllegionaminate synthase